MTLEADEEPISPVALEPGFDQVAALSSRGRLLVFPLAEMREVPRGRGVIIIGLDGDEKLVAVDLSTANKVIVRGINRLGRAVAVTIEGEALAKHLHRRARKGALAAPTIKVTGFGHDA
jgi:topoisomerase-4 subunit A